jgi:large subunit ribosomal protein L4
MAATVLTVDAAIAAQIPVVENNRYTQVVHDAVVAYRANRRSGTAHTKSKADVNLSGAKPWRQKGTGRARAGYKSSPVWVGGGVAFGPKHRDYSKKLSKAARRLALRKALSERIKAGDVLVIDSFAVAEPKTREFVKLLHGITPEAKTLVVAAAFDEKTYRAARNVQPALLLTANDLNAEHVLLYKKVVLTNDALVQIAERINK